MNGPLRLLGMVAGAAGVASAGAAVSLVRRRQGIARRDLDRDLDKQPLGSLHSPPRTVVAADGVPLHVEVDELEPHASHQRLEGTLRLDTWTEADEVSPLTVVFCHGYALNLDCWHFQRAGFRGLVRTVFYDQRSHGRSGRATPEGSSIEMLGRDLVQVLDEVVPDGPVVLVGHSMGGMAVISLVEEHPELIGDRVVGVALISTTAGGLDPSRIFLPLVPARVGGVLATRVIRALSTGHRAVDGVRRAGQSIAAIATDAFAFGDDVPGGYVEFVDSMLAATPFEVVADFFPSFRGLDKFDFVEVLSRVPTTIICGTSDRLTSIGHSRKLASRITGSTLIECEGAGHMVILERHGQVNAALDQLLSAATSGIGSR